MNGVEKIKPFAKGNVKRKDLIFGLMSLLGASVSSMPKGYESRAYSSNWELFDPEKVEHPEELPRHWKAVYEVHNKPEMKDCRQMRYRYVHVPVDILPHYPRVPCRGIFCLVNNEIKGSEVTAEDLIHIGNEFDKEVQ